LHAVFPSNKQKCTESKKGRTISINDCYHLVIQVKEYNRTEEGNADLKRRTPVERVNGVLKNRFGLKVIKSWGKEKYKIQGYWAAIAYNISRALKLLDKISPNSLAPVSV